EFVVGGNATAGSASLFADMNGNGDAIVGFDRSGAFGAGLYVQLYTASDASSSRETFVPSPRPASIVMRGVGMAADGGFVVAWEDSSGRFQRFDANGVSQGPPVQTGFFGEVHLP